MLKGIGWKAGIGLLIIGNIIYSNNHPKDKSAFFHKKSMSDFPILGLFFPKAVIAEKLIKSNKKTAPAETYKITEPEKIETEDLTTEESIFKTILWGNEKLPDDVIRLPLDDNDERTTLLAWKLYKQFGTFPIVYEVISLNGDVHDVVAFGDNVYDLKNKTSYTIYSFNQTVKRVVKTKDYWGN